VPHPAEPRIEDYGLIGDCETAALVSRTGSIDWLCLPRFDSDAVFAALLGDRNNGAWSIAPKEPFQSSRRYRDGTLILETRFETAEGAATLIDFMPPNDGYSDLVRIVVGEKGRLRFHTDFTARFDYGLTVPWVSRHDDYTLTAVAGPGRLVLRTSVELRGEGMHTVGDFTVAPGERVSFTLTHCASHRPLPPPRDTRRALKGTEKFWREFSDRCPPVGRWTEIVKRSLITLKALTYAPTGGIVAAPTTSLPEKIGGTRNWDYRYCWLRDATFTLLAFMKLGYYEEAHAFRDWLLRAVAGDPAQMQIMYGIAGERRLPEWEVPWLAGFRGSKPVRVGNAAAGQFQLDVYGELADALDQAARGGLPRHPRQSALGAVVMPYLERVWHEPDDGIWEIRAPRRHFTHSKVMAWVAFDRAVAMALVEGDRDLARRWRLIADSIKAEVLEKGFDPALNSFVQSYGESLLDASLLQLPLVGFIRADDPRMLGTVAAIERHLMHDGLVHRYNTSLSADGLPPGEGAFLACSFWLADNYVLSGRHDDAEALFERLLGLGNELGLFAEEYDPAAGGMLGNFPQAFSHVGMVDTALNLARREGPAKERAEPAPDVAVAER
jgi:GH15 family glucan-1,4-alpha-glucosidase